MGLLVLTFCYFFLSSSGLSNSSHLKNYQVPGFSMPKEGRGSKDTLSFFHLILDAPWLVHSRRDLPCLGVTEYHLHTG